VQGRFLVSPAAGSWALAQGRPHWLIRRRRTMTPQGVRVRTRRPWKSAGDSRPLAPGLGGCVMEPSEVFSDGFRAGSTDKPAVFGSPGVLQTGVKGVRRWLAAGYFAHAISLARIKEKQSGQEGTSSRSACTLLCCRFGSSAFELGLCTSL
jgi:hypothetical protein